MYSVHHQTVNAVVLNVIIVIKMVSSMSVDTVFNNRQPVCKNFVVFSFAKASVPEPFVASV
jgi:hypothetical protein